MTETTTLACPKCRAPMRTYERSGILVDQCTECRGVFLDRGELERLMDAESVAAGGTRAGGARAGDARSGDPLGDRDGGDRALDRGRDHDGRDTDADWRRDNRGRPNAGDRRRESRLGSLFDIFGGD